MKFGHVIPGYEGQNLADLYQMPSPQASQERLLQKSFQFLVDRYSNRAAFRLSSAAIMDAKQEKQTTEEKI